MHPRNRFSKAYDFEKLASRIPELTQYLIPSAAGHQTLDFSDPAAIHLLNKALLLSEYGLDFWDLPPGRLVPGVPGRLDYIHAIQDLLIDNKLATGAKVTGLDIGTGASLIFPILGVEEYGWKFIATDIDQESLRAAKAIISFNPGLQKKITLRHQPKATSIFQNIIQPGERITFTMCNPPFFESAAAAQRAAKLKWDKLNKSPESKFSFGGSDKELWTPGGEPAFLRQMIRESASFLEEVTWFTTLVSQKGYLKAAEHELKKARVSKTRIIELDSGNKARRILCWSWT